jgi:hypothetical protein
MRDFVSEEEAGYELFMSKSIVTASDKNVSIVIGITICLSWLTIRIFGASLW